jgi:hypothetical protein
VQHLRTLIRNARKEQAENKPPKAYREIFQILKQIEADKRKAARDEDDEATPSTPMTSNTSKPPAPPRRRALVIGLVSVSDRASGGVYPTRASRPCKTGWRAR